MDRSEVRRKALLAAATVTLAMGCRAEKPGSGGEVLVETDTPMEVPADTDRVDGVADSDAEGPADSDPADSDPADSDPVDSDPLHTDVAHTDPPVDTAPPEPDCIKDGLDPTTCCDLRQAWCGSRLQPNSPAWQDCVWGPNFDGSTGCIPWGPPVPPRVLA